MVPAVAGVPVEQCGGEGRIGRRVGVRHPLILTVRRSAPQAAMPRSLAITQLDVAAHGLQAYVAGTLAARALQAASGAVLAGALALHIEAIGDIAAERRDFEFEAALGAGAHPEVAADRSRLQARTPRELARETHVPRGAAPAHRARAVERHHQRSAHRAPLEIPGAVFEVDVAAHGAHAQPCRLTAALELDFAAHGFRLDIGA